MRSPTLPFACLPLLVACAGSAGSGDSIRREVIQIQTPGAVHMVEMTRSDDVARGTLNADVERVWAGLPDAFGALGLTGGGMIPGHPRTYGFRGRMPRRVAGKRPSTYLDCGRGMTGPNADAYDVRLLVATSVEPADASTTLVTTAVEASATPRGASAAPVRCTSSGALERAVVEALGRALQGAP